MTDEQQKIIDEQEKEILRLKGELKKAVSLKSFGSVWVRTAKMWLQDICDREQKIKRQTERIRELEKELSKAGSKASESKETADQESPQENVTEGKENSASGSGVSESPKPKIVFEKCSFKALRNADPSSVDDFREEQDVTHKSHEDLKNNAKKEPSRAENQKQVNSSLSFNSTESSEMPSVDKERVGESALEDALEDDEPRGFPLPQIGMDASAMDEDWDDEDVLG